MRTTISEPLRVLLADVTNRHLIVHHAKDGQVSRIGMLRYSNESGTESADARTSQPRRTVSISSSFRQSETITNCVCTKADAH